MRYKVRVDAATNVRGGVLAPITYATLRWR